MLDHFGHRSAHALGLVWRTLDTTTPAQCGEELADDVAGAQTHSPSAKPARACIKLCVAPAAPSLAARLVGCPPCRRWTIDEHMARGAQEPADAAPPSRLRLPGRLPGAAVLVGAAVMLGAVLLACGTAVPTPSPTPGGPGVGVTAQLADGALARLNGVETGVQLDPELPSQEPGMRLDRLDVEVCAGREPLFVDAAFWNGVGSDQRVHSAYMGVRSFFTLSLAPGSCQRGPVELALPEGVELQSVLLMDTSQTTAARWSVEGPAAGEIAPLASSVAPRVAEVGATVELEVGGTATIHSIDTGAVVVADAELCAADQPLPTSPRHWFLRLADNHLQPADGGAPGSAAFAGTVAARDCARGTLDFAVAPGTTPVSVLYAYGGQFEQSSWAVDR